MAAIYFFEEDIVFSIQGKARYKKWLKSLIEERDYNLKELCYIFCSDEFLYNINFDFLNHNTFTDVITFDHSEKIGVIEGEIYISIERITENAALNNTKFEDELLRVMSHGLLHLMGQKDKSIKDKKLMTQLEDKAVHSFKLLTVSRETPAKSLNLNARIK